MYAAQNAVLLYVRSTPILIVDDEEFDVLAGLLEPELALEPHPAIPAMRAAAARPATAVTPKRLRSTIGPPVSTSSGYTAAHTPRSRGIRAARARPAARDNCADEGRVRAARAWKIDPMYVDVNGPPRSPGLPSPN